MSYDDDYDMSHELEDEERMVREGNPHRSRRRMGADAGCIGVMVILFVMGLAVKVLYEMIAGMIG